MPHVLCKGVRVRATALLTAAACLLLTPRLNAQEIIFSHRVYSAKGRSYQQLWLWSAETGMPTQMSRAERDHRFPTCEPDGRHILFSSEENLLTTTRWRLDRTTGAEAPLSAPPISVAPVPSAPSSTVPTACDSNTARVSPDGRRIACAVGGTDVLIADARTLQEIARVPFSPRYSTGEPYPPWPMVSYWSSDGRTLLVANYGERGGSTTASRTTFCLT